MTTLDKRATPRQARVLRMIEGAVRNAAHAHPDAILPPRFARSIAKRAAGTLTSQWRDVLALPAAAASESADGHSWNRQSGEAETVGPASRRGASQVRRRAPVRFLHNAVGRMAGEAKRAGDIARHEALRDVLRLIGKTLGER